MEREIIAAIRANPPSANPGRAFYRTGENLFIQPEAELFLRHFETRLRQWLQYLRLTFAHTVCPPVREHHLADTFRLDAR